MPVMRKPFGRLKDGRSVDSVLLSDTERRFSVEILEYGATLRAIKVVQVDGTPIDTLLSLTTLAEYENGNAYLGATIGRCAGRTAADAHPTLRLTRNEATNHLHGGTMGFSHSLWQTVAIEDGDTPKVHLRHHSPAGEDGYPGALTIDAEFAIVDALTLRVVMRAHADADTPINLTQHPYFNLSGDAARAIDDHCLCIDADYILPLSPTLLPTGELLPVQGTPFDFRVARPVGASGYASHQQLRQTGGYDHYYVLREGAPIAAEVYCPRTALGLRVTCNQMGLQFYTGNHLVTASPRPFAPRSGLCLEPHGFPNAINEPGFPDITLRQGDVYRYETRYEFYQNDSTA